MCDSSWAITPSSSTRFIFSSSPVVTAIAAWRGLRPVANTFGAGSSIDVHAGLGQPAGDAQPVDEVVQSRVLLRVGGLGPADGEGDAVGLPVRGERERAGDDEGDDDPDPAEADEVAGRRADHDGITTKAATSSTRAPLVRADQFEHGARDGKRLVVAKRGRAGRRC